ncbi:MAG: hypothetical protein FIA97_08360 [Methylococcaceae bacterium]|nr:hypothetical protein [Methylococcaceae bacterium]
MMTAVLRRYVAGPGRAAGFVRAVLGSAGLRLAGMALGLAVSVQLARSLGAEGFGAYGLAMSLVALAGVPAEFGLPQLLTREVAAADASGNWQRTRGLCRWSLQATLGFTALLAAGGWLYWHFDPPAFAEPVLQFLPTALWLVPLAALVNQLGAMLRGLQQIVKGQLADALVRPAGHSLLLLAAGLCALPPTPQTAMAMGVAAAAMALAVNVVLLWLHRPHPALFASPAGPTWNWWASALPMAATQGMRMLQGHWTTLLLGGMSAVSAVGLYKVAAAVALLVAVPGSVLNVVAAPVISRLYTEGDRVALQRLMAWIALAMAAGSLGLSLPFFIDGFPLLQLLFGDSFADAGLPLAILCGSAVINGCFGANSLLLNMAGHHLAVTRISVAALLVLMAVSPPLVAELGAAGAAWATALSSLLWNIGLWRAAARRLGLDTSLKALLKP